MSEKRKQPTLESFFEKKTQQKEDVQVLENREKQMNILSTSTENVQKKAESLSINWPSIWNADMSFEKKKKYAWLKCDSGKLGCLTCSAIQNLGPLKKQGVSISKEWSGTEVSAYGKDKASQLTSLRKKIYEHCKSFSHTTAEKILKEADKQKLEVIVDKMNDSEICSTSKVFRTAYYIAKHDRPYSDHFDLLKLQEMNGSTIAHGLRSRLSATEIIDHIGIQMKSKICQQILKIQGNLSIIIDESTTLSKMSSLIIYLKCETDKMKDPHFVFLDLIELQDQTANTITECLLKCLEKNGFDDNYLKHHLISFTSDGASVMLGRKSGVATRLAHKYPNVITWHCLNHRLELSVGDAISEVNGVNHFQIFMDKLYSLYSQSPKNQREIETCATALGVEIKRIGRIFNIRWVTSSFRTVSAVWQNWSSLCHHFENASKDNNRTKTEQSLFNGLYKRISSKQFVQDLALMYDVLFELSILSEALQKRETSIVYADKFIRRTINYLEYLKNPQKGKKLLEAACAVEIMQLSSISLTDNKKFKLIHRNQFLTSIINNMRNRLNTTSENCSGSDGISTSESSDIVKELRILEPTEWPSEINMDFGEKEVESLCQRFNLPLGKILNAFRDYLACGGRHISEDLETLKKYSKIIACSSSECERGFSSMNLIVTERRSRILIYHVANLLFIKLHGPPLELWNPILYVKTWLRSHRSANDEQTKRAGANNEIVCDSIWDFL